MLTLELIEQEAGERFGEHMAFGYACDVLFPEVKHCHCIPKVSLYPPYTLFENCSSPSNASLRHVK